MSTRPLFAASTATSPQPLPQSLSAIVFMKVGFHVNECLDQIITRKRGEQENCGRIFWGYGGNSCHPTNQVLPFVAAALSARHRPVLAMKLTESKFLGELRFATEYSAGGDRWTPLPPGAMVKGSRYALVCRNLERIDKMVDLAEYQVAAGPNSGKSLSSYLRYRVDKACASFVGKVQASPRPVEITYIAELVEPYAVFLR